MIQPSQALNAIPAGLRDPLLSEYQSIVQNFMERRWSPSELSGGKFSEIVRIPAMVITQSGHRDHRFRAS